MHSWAFATRLTEKQIARMKNFILGKLFVVDLNGTRWVDLKKKLADALMDVERNFERRTFEDEKFI